MDRMEEDYDNKVKSGSPIAKYIRNELPNMKKQKVSETSIVDFSENEAKIRNYYENETNYPSIGPSYRDTIIYDEPFFEPEVKPLVKNVQHKLEDCTFSYKILLGYSDANQIDYVKKALLETTIVIRENTCEPTKELMKLLKFLRDAHPLVRKLSNTKEEKKADVLHEKLANNHFCLVYKLEIECHNMDQIKMIEDAVLESSVIVFSNVSPNFKSKPEILKPTLKIKVKERIKNIFNLGPLH
jgi:hypothetical protein